MTFIQSLNIDPLKFIFFTIISYSIYVYILKPVLNVFRMFLHYRSFPTTPRHFLLGHIKDHWTNFPFPYKLIDIQMNVCKTATKLATQDQPLLAKWATIFPFILGLKAETVETILHRVNLRRSGLSTKFTDLDGGLVTSEPELWKVRRKLIEPFFTTKKIKSQIATMNAEVESFCSKLNEMVGKPVDLEHQIHLSALNIILKSILNIPLDDSIEEKQEIIKLIDEMEPNYIKGLINPFYHFNWVFKYTEFGRHYIETGKIFQKLLNKLLSRREYLLNNQSNHTKNEDFIDLVEGKVDEKGIHAELKTIIAAGHDTTAVSLLWILFNLGNHLKEQERLYHEITESFPGDTPVDNLDMINSCTYLDASIKETLRLNPPIMGTTRNLAEDIMFKGKKLLKGTVAGISFTSIHRDPNIYSEPDKYDPDRWSPENAIKIPKTAYIPFGYGPRTCIANRFALIELKIYIIGIIRKFSVRSTRKHGSIPVKFQFTSKPISPLEIIITPRNTDSNT